MMSTKKRRDQLSSKRDGLGGGGAGVEAILSQIT
jgi:hypothetical protein